MTDQRKPRNYGQATVPAAVADYFGSGAEHPIIDAEYVPGRGWVSCRGYNKRISRSWARKRRAAGVTVLALRVGRRIADFRIAECVR